jgi:4-amino-4-deoxy-L-arabinose transferase
LLTTPWVPIATAALVVLPWAIMIHLREPDFWRYFFWVEHINRFAGDDPQHVRPFWFFVAYLPITGWPWMLLLPAALIGLRQSNGQTRILWYAAAWALVPLLFLSLGKGKLQTYILPCFAPASILLAAGLERYLAAGWQGALRIAVVVMVSLFVVMLGVVLAVQMGTLGGPWYSPSEHWPLAALVGSLLAGAGCAVFAYCTSRPAARLIAITVAGAALIVPLQVAVPDRALDRFAPGSTIERYAAASPDTIVVSDAGMFGAVAWALKRADIYVVAPGEIEYGLSYPESRHRWLEGDALAQLIEANRGRQEILVICWPSSESRVASRLPPLAERAQYGEVVFWRIPPS